MSYPILKLYFLDSSGLGWPECRPLFIKYAPLDAVNPIVISCASLPFDFGPFLPLRSFAIRCSSPNPFPEIMPFPCVKPETQTRLPSAWGQLFSPALRLNSRTMRGSLDFFFSNKLKLQ